MLPKYFMFTYQFVKGFVNSLFFPLISIVKSNFFTIKRDIFNAQIDLRQE